MATHDEVEEFLEEIDDLLSNSKYNFAGDTLRGIYKTVEERKTITRQQRQAIINIRESVSGPATKPWDRRYEGYSREK